MRDPYEVLGVGRDADDRQVKKAFRSLARELHPDPVLRQAPQRARTRATSMLLASHRVELEQARARFLATVGVEVR